MLSALRGCSIDRKGQIFLSGTPTTPQDPITLRDPRLVPTTTTRQRKRSTALHAQQQFCSVRAIPPPLNTPYDAEISALYFPALVSLLVEPLLSLTDTAVVGRLGTAALAGVGLATYTFGLLTFLFSFLGIVTTASVASASANEEGRQSAALAIADAAWVAICAGFAAGTMLWCGCGHIVTAMGAKADVAAASIAYSRARAWGLIPGLLMFVVAGAFRGIMDTKTPALIAAAGLILNAALDVVLALRLGWGVRGAAVATMVTQAMQVVTATWVLHRRGVFKIQTLLKVPSRERLLPLLAAGATLQARTLCVSGMMMWASMLALAINPETLAAHELVRQFWVLSSYVFLAGSVAVQPLVASALSLPEQRGLPKAVAVTVRGMQLGTLMGCLLAMAVLVLGGRLPRVFVDDEHVVQLVVGVLPVMVVSLPLEGMEKVLEGSLLGARQIPWIARNTIVTTVVCAAALLATRSFGFGLLGIWLSVRLLSLGRLLGGLQRFNSSDGPFVMKQPGRKAEPA